MTATESKNKMTNSTMAYEWMNDELIVLDTQVGRYYQLNETAGKMLIALSEGKTVTETAQMIELEFSVEPEQALKDVIQLQSDFSQKGLLVSPDKNHSEKTDDN